MPVVINGDTGITTPSVALPGSTSGTATISPPAVAGTTTITTPTNTGTMVTGGPAFAAYLSGSQTVTSGTITLAQLATELFDTASCFNNTNATVGGIPAYAFLPNVAGYYQVNFAVMAAGATTNTYAGAYIYKNGTAISRNSVPGWSATNGDSNTTRIVYMDGATDYLQFYGQSVGTGAQTLISGESRTLATAAFIRPA